MRLLNDNLPVNNQLHDLIPSFVLLKKWGVKLKKTELLSDTVSKEYFIYVMLREAIND